MDAAAADLEISISSRETPLKMDFPTMESTFLARSLRSSASASSTLTIVAWLLRLDLRVYEDCAHERKSAVWREQFALRSGELSGNFLCFWRSLCWEKCTLKCEGRPHACALPTHRKQPIEVDITCELHWALV